MLTRCVCMELPFVQLLAYARRYGIASVGELGRCTRAGTGCGSCRPYLEDLLASGEIVVGGARIALPAHSGPLEPPLDRPPSCTRQP